jgi:hypothetical protein
VPCGCPLGPLVAKVLQEPWMQPSTNQALRRAVPANLASQIYETILGVAASYLIEKEGEEV